jgi:hypothetical protein
VNPLAVQTGAGTRLVQRALAGRRQRQGWRFVGRLRVPAPVREEHVWLYKVTLAFQRRGRKVKADVVQRQFDYIGRIVEAAANARGWTLPGTNLGGASQPQAAPPQSNATAVTLPDNMNDYFAHIYDREAQIGIVAQAIRAAVQSGFQNRNHCVLFGPPACGKSEILLAFKNMLGADAVMTFDATSTTEAGARRELRELARIPPILIVEEIEKTDERSLRWLLGVLDTRGEIRGLNYRDAHFRRDVKLLCLATANDIGRFNEVMSGALASRFANKARCPRPTRPILERILQREVAKIAGNPAWIKPALDYCLDIEKSNDPRRAIAVCLCGQDKLLTGEYQRWLAATGEPRDGEGERGP